MNKIILGYNQLLCSESILNGNFKLSLFENLNRLVEAIVLYDKIVLLGEYNVSSNQIYDELAKAGIIESIDQISILQIVKEPNRKRQFCESFQPIFNLSPDEANDLDFSSLIQEREDPNSSAQATLNLFAQTIKEFGKNRHSLNENLPIWLRNNVYNKRDQGGLFGYFSRSLIYNQVAEVKEMDYSPDFLRMPIAALNFNTNYRSIPRLLYEELSTKFNSEVSALASLGMPVPFFIPPLTARVLDRKVPINKFIMEVLSIREEFQSFRKKYNDFKLLLQSDNVSLKEKIKAKNSFFTSILGIVNKGEPGHALNIKTVWNKVIGAKLDDQGFDANLSVSGLASLIVNQALAEKTKGKARAIFDLWTDSLNIKNYGSLIQSYFKTEIDKKEIDFLLSYSNSIRMTIRS